MYKAYFNEIFETNKSVIIPGLGSFSKSNSIITYNPYLKFNDGFLVAFIAKKQNISIETAGNLIAENVDKINTALNSSGEAMVLGLGILKRNADGKIVFVQDDAITNTEAEKPNISPVNNDVKTETKSVIIEPEIKIKTEDKKGEVPIQPIENSHKHDLKNVKAPELKEVVSNDKPIEKKVEKKKSKESKVKTNDNVGKQKRKFPILLMIIVVVIGGASIFAVLKWDMVKSWIGMDKKETVKVEKQDNTNEKPVSDTLVNEVVANDTIANDTIAVNSENPPVVEEEKSTNTNPEIPVQENTNSSTGNFHIIIGCYSSQQNAQNMVQKLISEGHQGNNMGLRGGFYMVSAGDFSTADDANTKLQSIKSTHPKAWLYNGL